MEPEPGPDALPADSDKTLRAVRISDRLVSALYIVVSPLCKPYMLDAMEYTLHIQAGECQQLWWDSSLTDLVYN
jgi:hypothetical protein